MLNVEQVETMQERAAKMTVELDEKQSCNERLKNLDLFSSSKRRLIFNRLQCVSTFPGRKYKVRKALQSHGERNKRANSWKLRSDKFQ